MKAGKEFKTIPVILIIFLLFISINGIAQEIKCARATVYEGVPVAADGCGVMVKIDSVVYKAEGIPEEIVADGLEVLIKYTEGEIFYCGRGRAPIPTIHIRKIKKASGIKKCRKNPQNK